MRIDEILFADAIPSINWFDIDLSSAKEFAHLDGQSILELEDGPTIFYLILDKHNDVMAYSAILKDAVDGYYPLVRMENIAKIKGLITMIIFAITMQGKNLIIQRTEELTHAGLLWIGKILMNGGRGLTFSDQDGNKIDFADLSKEHSDAEITHRCKEVQDAKTAILITNRASKEKLQHINEKTEKWKSNIGLLKPAYTFMHSKDLW